MSTDRAADYLLIAQQLRERALSVSAADKPSYSVDGQSVDWTTYLQMLLDQAAKLEAMAANAQGPWEVQTQVR